jgi:hypothetical protein
MNVVDCRPSLENKKLAFYKKSVINSAIDEVKHTLPRSKREAKRKRAFRRKNVDKMSDAEFYSYVQLRALMG